MIVLSETTDNLQVVLSGSVTTNQLRCVSSWRDRTSTTFVAGRTVINTNNTTDVNIVSAPAASTQRIVDYISIYNYDISNATVTIKFDANGTEYIMFKATIGTGEAIEYSEGSGWKVFNNSGSIKQSINQGNNVITTGMSATVLGADVVNANATANTIADVTGLSFVVVPGTFYFKFIIRYTSAATATGSRWSINGPAFSQLAFSVGIPLIATANSTDAISDSCMIAYDQPPTANGTSPNNTATGGAITIIEGLITATEGGTVVARFSSEVSASAITAKAGSVVYYQQVI